MYNKTKLKNLLDSQKLDSFSFLNNRVIYKSKNKDFEVHKGLLSDFGRTLKYTLNETVAILN